MCIRDRRKKKAQAELLQVEIESLKKKASELEKRLEHWKETEQAQDETVEQMQILNLRKRLREGEPCPVCGSVHFAKEETQKREVKGLESEALEKLELLKKQIEEAEETLRAVRQEESIKQTLLATVREELLDLEKRTEETANELEGKKHALQAERCV